MSSFYHGLVIYNGPGDNQYLKEEIDQSLDATKAVLQGTNYTRRSRKGLMPIDEQVFKSDGTLMPHLTKTNLNLIQNLLKYSDFQRQNLSRVQKYEGGGYAKPVNQMSSFF